MAFGSLVKGWLCQRGWTWPPCLRFYPESPSRRKAFFLMSLTDWTQSCEPFVGRREALGEKCYMGIGAERPQIGRGLQAAAVFACWPLRRVPAGQQKVPAASGKSTDPSAPPPRSIPCKTRVEMFSADLLSRAQKQTRQVHAWHSAVLGERAEAAPSAMMQLCPFRELAQHLANRSPRRSS